jgi:hypothetical protein
MNDINDNIEEFYLGGPNAHHLRDCCGHNEMSYFRSERCAVIIVHRGCPTAGLTDQAKSIE